MSASATQEPALEVKPAKSGSRWAWRNLKGRFLIVSIAFNVLLALVATYLMVTPRTTANKAVEHKVTLAKQTKSGQPTETKISGGYAAPEERNPNGTFRNLVHKFIERGMGEGSLDRYFAGPATLYASQIYIPALNADEAPKAFDLEGKAQPRRWIVVYKGSVTPPESGQYRFVGGADDILAVRSNGRLVFGPGVKNQKFYAYGRTYQKGGTVGVTFDVKAGVPYPISIVIGEMPGGSFMAYLLIEKVGAEYQTNGQGSTILPLFKLAPSTVTRVGGTPEFAPDTPRSIWKVASRR